MKIVQGKFKILSNIPAGEKYFKLCLDAGKIARPAVPGQFVMVRVSEGIQPLLRRPLGVHGVSGNKVELLYEIIGQGTVILSQKKPGEYLDVIGPLGNGFTFRHRAILIAGGMGVAPLVFLAEKLSRSRPMVLIGGQSKGHILCADEFSKLGCSVKIATDDGSLGFKGKVTELLENILKSRHCEPCRGEAIFACGPGPMLKEISRLSQEHKIDAQLSLEAHMSCGFGVCLGCSVETKSSQKKVCQDGPVFDSQEIVWR